MGRFVNDGCSSSASGISVRRINNAWSEAYQASGSVYALAHQFGITRQTAAAILGRHGIKRRYKVLSADDVAEASHLYEAGWSLARLGEHFDVNPSTILNALRRTDITIRPVGTNQWHERRGWPKGTIALME